MHVKQIHYVLNVNNIESSNRNDKHIELTVESFPPLKLKATSSTLFKEMISACRILQYKDANDNDTAYLWKLSSKEPRKIEMNEILISK